MVNCNPETVSTDYDTSGRLYFEPLTLEDVLEVVHAEQATGRSPG
jgi:carbamoyl-phosphate synthase large subunit